MVTVLGVATRNLILALLSLGLKDLFSLDFEIGFLPLQHCRLRHAEYQFGPQKRHNSKLSPQWHPYSFTFVVFQSETFTTRRNIDINT